MVASSFTVNLSEEESKAAGSNRDISGDGQVPNCNLHLLILSL